MRLMDLMWFGLVLVVAVALFVLKYEVQNLEDTLAGRNADIDAHARAIQVLEAEWTFLNDPARLRRLGLEHLELAPVEPARIISIDAIPFRAVETDSASQLGVGQ
ncbi:MAG: hypothetical protein HN793_11165 [Rhodospirillaceae bacterium]|jgi:hypothetical protein|nr:hypothetical protein [Rhodospirillaceae bacterium]MBT5565235.1 hypothetical protein [Rhodospirillaceae bacterium]MBT6091093.1 hypothetical protein [Rhodospirillaceae bacterium]MBT6961157.1 hypothetical protein [Rhodospirillaceae bacterium]MBT7451379.1 hypothetical protein [Rhodospirillaceae bacterium]